MKRLLGVFVFFISIFLSFAFHPINSVLADHVTVSFTLLNDDQIIESQTLLAGDYLVLPTVGETIISRDNVVLAGWYFDEDLIDPFSAEEDPILTSLTLFSEWRYLNDSIKKATLVLSLPGTSFTTGSLTLSLPLYLPLAENVTYQWQYRLVGGPNWIDIEGATESTYTPTRNGTFEFRVKYFIQQWSMNQWQEVRKESESMTLTFSGAFDWQWVFLPLGVLLLTGLIFWINRKQPIEYYMEGQLHHTRFAQVYEDISVQPTMEKEGYTFSGWFLDASLTIPFEGMRMPRKKVKLYATYRKKT